MSRTRTRTCVWGGGGCARSPTQHTYTYTCINSHTGCSCVSEGGVGHVMHSEWEICFLSHISMHPVTYMNESVSSWADA